MPITSIAAQEQMWNRHQLEQPVAVPQWRVWCYQQPALVLGCSQRTLLDRAAGTAGSAPLELLLRESGGGAVLVGPWMLGLSLVLPAGHAWLGHGLLESYHRLGQLHAEALAGLGVTAQALAPSAIEPVQAKLAARGLPVPQWACFGSLSPWEVVDAQGRKLVGLAQRRRQSGVLLVAGTLLSDPPWNLLCEALGQAQDRGVLQQRTVSCASLARRSFDPEAVAEVLRARLQAELGESERAMRSQRM